MLADYAFYTGRYGGGLLSEADFARYEPYAERYIHTITFSRLLRGAPVTDAVQLAVCAVTEVLAEQAEAADSHRTGARSETVGSYSITYEDPAVWEAASRRARMQAAAPYLLPTGLMDRGIRHVHEC